uniref:Replication protein A subunit n=1 Tax=Lutzomyia longipalpis TaxID=7200 RepID=A0A1B0CNK6_LUTLO
MDSSDWPELSRGAIRRLIDGAQEQPVLQILGAKLIPNSENERYRLLISDGLNLHSYAMLTSQLNYMFKEGSLADFSIFRLKRFNTSNIPTKPENSIGRRVIVLLDIEILTPGGQVGVKIGNPVALEQKPEAANMNGGSGSGAASTAPGTPGNQRNKANLNDSISLENSVINPICSLTPYQNKWVIKARVTHKATVRTWKNDKGEGKLFSFELVDQSGEIRATAFRDQVDKFYDMLEVDKVYLVSKCSLKPADKRFNNTKNEYELTLNNETIIQECFDDMEVPTTMFNFVPISQITNMEPNSLIDVVGVCTSSGEVVKFTSRASGRDLQKREVTLVDTSKASVNLTLWGNDAENFDCTYQPVVAIKGARITEFGGGKSISLIGSSIMKMNPDIPEGHKIRGWFDNGGAEDIDTNISTRTGTGTGMKTDWVTFHEAKMKNLGMGDNADYFQTKGIVHLVRSNNCVYKSCPQASCNKKVVDQDDGTYRCEKCGTSYPNFKYRYLLSMSIGDWTSNRWVTCFDEVAEQIIGKSAQEMGELLSTTPDEGEAALHDIHFSTYIFKLRIKMEHFGDNSRNKISVVTATPVNYNEYNEYLIKNLSNLTGITAN